MTADEWFEIEDNGIGGKWTMEDVAKLGPEGREFHRNARIILTSLHRICLSLMKTFMTVIR
jgi:hypothetical protein